MAAQGLQEGPSWQVPHLELAHCTPYCSPCPPTGPIPQTLEDQRSHLCMRLTLQASRRQRGVSADLGPTELTGCHGYGCSPACTWAVPALNWMSPNSPATSGNSALALGFRSQSVHEGDSPATESLAQGSLTPLFAPGLSGPGSLHTN